MNDFDRPNPFATPEYVAPDRKPGQWEPTHSDQRLNPWTSIWTQPRATIRQIVDENPTQSVILLAIVIGIDSRLAAPSFEPGELEIALVPYLLLQVIGGAIGGVIGIYVGALVLGWGCRLMGGVATSEEMRAAIAWAGVPAIYRLFIHIPLLAVFGERIVFVDLDDPIVTAAAAGLTVLIFVTAIWQVFIQLKCVAEVNQFSAWRALGAGFLVGLIVMAIIIVPLVLIIAMLGGNAPM